MPIQIKSDKGKWFLKSNGVWVLINSPINSIEDAKKLFKRDDIQMIGPASKPSGESRKVQSGRIEVMKYDGINLLIRDKAGEREIYFPEATREQIESFLKSHYESIVVTPAYLRYDPAKVTPERQKELNEWASKQPQFQSDPNMRMLQGWADELKSTDKAAGDGRGAA